MKELDRLFFPKSVAVVGATPDPEKLGGIVLRNLFRLKGAVYPVNPRYGEILGLRSYPSVADLPGSVDLSVILRPAAEVPALLEKLRDKTRFVLIVSAGFAEVARPICRPRLSASVGREGCASWGLTVSVSIIPGTGSIPCFSPIPV
jgi:acyl-CoA synthetase (NDP forming)